MGLRAQGRGEKASACWSGVLWICRWLPWPVLERQDVTVAKNGIAMGAGGSFSPVLSSQGWVRQPTLLTADPEASAFWR